MRTERRAKLKEPPVLKLIRRRRLLMHVVNSIPDSDAPKFSKAYERYVQLAGPFKREITELTRKIGERPRFWKPRPKTKEDYRIERQYAEAAK